MKKVLLISGGTSGIGLAITKLFVSNNYRVIIASRDRNKFNSNFENSNKNLHFIETDFNEMDSVKNLYSVIGQEYKSIDVAVNNVGIAVMKSMIDCDEDDFDTTINVNLKSLWMGLKNQIPLMLKDKENSKHIINISSLNGLGGAEFLSLYAAAKAGVISLTKSAALEYANTNISINALVPGPFDTPMLSEALLSQAKGDLEKVDLITQQYKQIIPRGRFGKPEEIAETILWLSQNKTNFISGHSLIIDGGLSNRFR